MFKQRFQVSACVMLGLFLHAGMASAEDICPDGESPERMREIAAEAFAEGQWAHPTRVRILAEQGERAEHPQQCIAAGLAGYGVMSEFAHPTAGSR